MNEKHMSLDQQVLVRLLLKERAMLLGYIGSLVRETHHAEDVFQDVALIILKKRDELSDPSGFPAWARKIARLEALNAMRRMNKAPRLLGQAVLDLLDLHWAAADEGPSLDALHECLERLPPGSRQLVQLRYREGISGKDLAERMSKPLNTVYVALARVHRALSECIRSRQSIRKASHA